MASKQRLFHISGVLRSESHHSLVYFYSDEQQLQQNTVNPNPNPNLPLY